MLGKKVKKVDFIYIGEKNPEHCDTLTHNVIRQNFEKSSTREN